MALTANPSNPSTPSSRQLRTQQLLLTTLQQAGRATRDDLTRLTGLSRSAVAAGVQRLLAEHRLTEQPIPTRDGRRRGRPSAWLTVTAAVGPVIGIDFGHTHVRVAVANNGGELLAERCQESNVDSQPLAALDTAAHAVASCLVDADIQLDDIRAVAACIPGPLDLATDMVRSPTILAGWIALNPRKELADRIGRPVTVGNDANMGAHGELHYGAARGYRDFLYIKASHGIGAGLVLNGQAYRGSLGIAGEIGHTQLPGATNWCRCGSRGCLETVLTITEIRRQLVHILGPDLATAPLTDLSHNPAAARVLTDAGRTLGRVLADLCNCLNPAAIVLGGELGTAGQPVISGIRESLDRYAQPATAAAATVHPATLGARAELMGAIATALHPPPVTSGRVQVSLK